MLDADGGRRAVKAAREMAHLATSLASEAATFARIFEGQAGLQGSLVAASATVEAARHALEIDALAISPEPPALDDVMRRTDAALDAALAAIQAARASLAHARSSGAAGGHAGAGAM